MTQARLCPICSRPVTEDALASRFRPFCSRRCADVDLGRWLKGVYAIPAAGLEDEAETEPLAPETETGATDGTPAQAPRKPIHH